MRVLLLLVLFTGVFFPLNYDEAIEKLTDSFDNKLETFRAEVTQEVKIADMTEAQVLKGTITIKKPDKILLEYTSPVKQNIISDGKTLWVYFKEQNQVIVQEVAAGENKDNIIFQLPKYLKYLKDRYVGSLKEEEKYEDKEAVLMEFVPKTEGEDFTRIKLWVDKEKWLPFSTTVYIGESNSITVRFSNIRTNETTEDSVFDFKIPEGVEQITSLLQ
ncbi:MAG: outer membrane lipoprotein carrier protein LolA [Candidatus Firestonebacteria bacterium]